MDCCVIYFYLEFGWLKFGDNVLIVLIIFVYLINSNRVFTVLVRTIVVNVGKCNRIFYVFVLIVFVS